MSLFRTEGRLKKIDDLSIRSDVVALNQSEDDDDRKRNPRLPFQADVSASIMTSWTPSDLGLSGVLTTPVATLRPVEQSSSHSTMMQEACNGRFWKAARAEFISTMLLTILGCGSFMRIKVPPEQYLPDLDVKVSLTFGATIVVLLHCLGPISGGHMNPAVTLALLVTGQVSVLRAGVYLLAQSLGSLAGAGVLYGLTPIESRGQAGFGATQPRPQMHPSQAFGVEFLATLVVVLTVLTSAERTDRCQRRTWVIGTSYAAAHLFAFSYTGAGLNPARSFGPAIVANLWAKHWVYWAGPLLAGLTGGLVYRHPLQEASGLRRHFLRKLAREPKSGNETELAASYSSDLLNRV